MTDIIQIDSSAKVIKDNPYISILKDIKDNRTKSRYKSSKSKAQEKSIVGMTPLEFINDLAT